MMDTKVKCLVLDDDQSGLQILQNYIQKLPSLELIGLCQNPFEAIRIIQSGSVDILFLDIEMPDLNGLEVLDALPNRPLVIFTTGHLQYAIEGYKHDVVDYLLKPFRFARFVQAVNKAIRRMQLQRNKEIPAPIDTFKSQTKDYIIVKSEHKMHRIRYDEIYYIQGMKEYVAFHLKSGRIYSLLSLKSLEVELPKDRFLRIHKSYIVAIKQVHVLEGNRVHVQEEKLPIGSSYRQTVMGKIF